MQKWFARLRGLKFFWQLLLAILATTALMAVGIYIASRLAFQDVQTKLQHIPPPQTRLWLDRLSRYYGKNGGWDELTAMVESYPVGEDWAPWDEDWRQPVVITDRDGTILVAPAPDHVGETLQPAERALVQPIVYGGETVGYLWLPFNALPLEEGDFAAPLMRRRVDFIERVLGRFLLAEVLLIGLSLAMGVFLSRRIASPLDELTAATRAIARGKLDIRVPEDYPGEVGELASSFNRMAAALSRAEELRRNMTADIAHELRTPLSVVRGKLEGILDGVYPATEAHLAPALEEVALLSQLVEDLRVLALAEAGRLELDLREVDLADLLHDAAVNFGPMVADEHLSLKLDIASDLPSVLADWRRISQVLGNLITNAVRHTPAGGQITLAAYRTEDGVAVEVRDTGTGIPEEDQPHVFERFWRGDRSRARSSGGSGLGLAIARQLVELHGGNIMVESVVGLGTSMRFTLSCQSADSPSSVKPRLRRA